MTIDPKTLTAEERAIVDVEACRLNALGARGLPQPERMSEKVFQVALANVEYLILARRKFYGEAQVTGEDILIPSLPGMSNDLAQVLADVQAMKRLYAGQRNYDETVAAVGRILDSFVAPQEAKAVCPNCGAVVPHEHDHRDWNPPSMDPSERWICQPAPPTATVASEMPEAVACASHHLHRIGEHAAAYALAAWARQQQEAEENARKEGFDDGYLAGKTYVQHFPANHLSAAQFPKVRAFLDYMGMFYGGHDGRVWNEGTQGAIWQAAVAELDAAQAVPVEAIRYALSYLRSDTTKTNLLANIDTIDRWLAAVEGGR